MLVIKPLIALTVSIIMLPASADLYKCTGPDGSVTFQQTACVEQNREVIDQSRYSTSPMSDAEREAAIARMQEDNARLQMNQQAEQRPTVHQPEQPEKIYDPQLDTQIRNLKMTYEEDTNPQIKQLHAQQLVELLKRKASFGIHYKEQALSVIGRLADDTRDPNSKLILENAKGSVALGIDMPLTGGADVVIQNNQPTTVIDSKTGLSYKDTGGGFVGPGGIFYQKTAGGYINIKTGEFLPSN